MTRPTTQAERMIRLETLFEADIKSRAEDRGEMREKLDGMAADIKAIREKSDGTQSELSALKNKGAGILIGVGLAGGAIGASITAGAKTLMELFK